MAELFKKYATHSSLILILLLFVLLFVGLIDLTGFKHIPKILLVISSLLITYFLLFRYKLFEFLNPLSDKLSIKKSTVFNTYFPFGICILLFTIEIIVLKGLPGIKLFSIETTRQYAALRAGIHQDSLSIFKYLSGFLLKSFFPFAILHYLILGKRKLYFLLLVIASFYAFSMLQKSYIISILLPALIYVIYHKKYLDILLHVATILLVVRTLSIPSLINDDHVIIPPTVIVEEKVVVNEKVVVVQKETVETPLAEESFLTKQYRVLRGVADRIFFMPGNMVSNWFENIPKNKPFLYGDGYPIIAKIKGTTFVNYDLEMYKVIYPEFVKQGFLGSANCATFMKEYSNFGNIGLVLAGILLALLCIILNTLFKKYNLLFYCINLFPLFFLSSVNLFTQMFSGGWMLLILLFLIYKNSYTTKST